MTVCMLPDISSILDKLPDKSSSLKRSFVYVCIAAEPNPAEHCLLFSSAPHTLANHKHNRSQPSSSDGLISACQELCRGRRPRHVCVRHLWLHVPPDGSGTRIIYCQIHSVFVLPLLCLLTRIVVFSSHYFSAGRLQRPGHGQSERSPERH